MAAAHQVEPAYSQHNGLHWTRRFATSLPPHAICRWKDNPRLWHLGYRWTVVNPMSCTVDSRSDELRGSGQLPPAVNVPGWLQTHTTDRAEVELVEFGT